MFNGENGWAKETSMKILVRLGELFGAERLIPIESAHIAGVSYKTLGDAPIEFLRILAERGGYVKVPTTLNPQSLDTEYLERKVPEKLRKNQKEILENFAKMGIARSLTCTPYYLGQPRIGSHVAWSESSAVVYANSVLNVHTNREGGPSSLAAAIIGKTPDHGIHREENRKPNACIKLATRLKNEMEYGAFGICVGKILQDEIPLIDGIQNASKDELKQFSAAVASDGMTNMFLMGDSTNAKSKTEITGEDIKETIESLLTASTSEPDLVFIGCPHCSSEEIQRIAAFAEGKKVHKGSELWVCTSRYVKDREKQCVKKIERSGGHVLDGVCTIVSWTEKLGIKCIMTNSAKTAHYAPTMNKATVILVSLQECLSSVYRG